MPAYFDTGFSVRKPMWHGQGAVLDDYPTDWPDARVKAGLQWEPQIRPVYALHDPRCVDCSAELGLRHADRCPIRIGRELAGEVNVPEEQRPLVQVVDCDLAKAVIEIPNHRRVVRDDTDATLGVVSEQFSLVSHGVMGEILDAVLGQPNVKFETAGACKGGAQVWALAYVDEPVAVAGDDTETYPFVALLNNHDGSGACKLVATSVRVVCWNTYQAASMQGERSGRQFTFRHAGDVTARIDEAIKAMAGVRDESAAWLQLANDLCGMPVTEAHLNNFIADFIPEPPADMISPRVRSNIDRARATFRRIYLESETTEGHRGNALGLVDTAVEYLDHFRGFRSRDTYMGRTLLRPEPLKAKAVTLARRVCAAGA